MANYNLTDQTISSSFEQLLQKNTDTGELVDGVGVVVSDLVVTSSYALTASFAENVIDPTWNNITDKPSGLVSGSSQVDYPLISNIPSGIVSSSSQVILQDTTGLLSGSRIDGAVALATNSTYAQNTITTGKNLHTTTIAKGTPLYFTASGTSGNIVGVYPADAGNPARMPAGGIAGENIAVGAEGVVLLDGYIGNVNTSIFQSGDEIFVGVGGGYTNVVPTGSALIQHLGNVEKSDINGSGVIQMMGEVRGLPNIPQGNAWVGDINGVPQAVSTASWDAHSDLTQLNAFTASQEVLNTTFATTGSNIFNGNQIISGNLEMAPNTAIVGKVIDAQEISTPTLLVDSLEPNNEAQITLNGNTNISGTLDMASYNITASVGTFGTVQAGGYESIGGGDINFNSKVNVIQTFNIDGDFNASPETTLNVKDGNGTPILQVNNATLKGLTDVDVLVNGNQFVNGNISATGSLGIADNSFIISSGSNTIEFNPRLSTPGNAAQVLFNAGNANFNATGNFNIQCGDVVAIDAATRIDLNKDTVVNGNGTVSGSVIVTDSQVIEGDNSAGPTAVFGVFDGDDNQRIFVPNATLAGILGTDIQLDGRTTVNGSTTVNGQLTINNNSLQINNGFIYNSGAEYRGVLAYNPTSGTTQILNGQQSDFFQVNLPAGGNVNIDMSSYDQGRQFNLRIKQNGTTPATVTFASKFKFPGGVPYTVSPGLNAVDILDIRHYDGTAQDLYVTNVAQNFS